MPNGGRRPGAGRPKGRQNDATIERKKLVEAVLTAEGKTPIEVMREAMLYYDGLGKRDDAVRVAQALAPYIHPRLSNIDANAQVDGGLTIELVNFTAEDPNPQ